VGSAPMRGPTADAQSSGCERSLSSLRMRCRQTATWAGSQRGCFCRTSSATL